MVDMVKKIHKKSGDLLEDGEQLQAASVIMAVGQFKKTVAFGAIGGAVGAAVGAAIGGKGEGRRSGHHGGFVPRWPPADPRHQRPPLDRVRAEHHVRRSEEHQGLVAARRHHEHRRSTRAA